MNRVEAILSFLPLPLLIAVVAIPPIAFFLIPARYRLGVALAALPPWLALNLFQDMGMIAVLAKAASAITQRV